MSFSLPTTPIEFLEVALKSRTVDPAAALRLAKKEEQKILLKMNQQVQDLSDKHGEELQKAKNHVTALDIDNMMLRQEEARLRQENEGLRQKNERLLQENERLRQENEGLRQKNERLLQENERLRLQFALLAANK